jgi:hypothetical protein
MTGFPKQYRVRIKDSLGDKHVILAYGSTEAAARKNGLHIAQRLLEDKGVEIMWVKPV